MGNDSMINNSILDKASEIICIFDNTGKVNFLNSSGRDELGFDVSKVCIRDVLPNLFTDEVDVTDFVKENLNKSVKSYAYRSNHSCFPVMVKVCLEEEQGIVYMSDLRDVENLDKQIKSMEETMAETIKSRDEMTANLTHELRTPVNGIKGHIRNLKEQEEDSSKRRKMDIVLQCCENMERIINNLLDFAKLENGKMVLEEQAFSLHSLIESSVAAIESLANEKGLDIKYHIGDNVTDTVIGDEFRLSLIMNNFLNNAVKFTAEGHVGIEVFKTRQRKRDLELTFFVIDTGIGMSETDKDKLFKSFSQVDGSITRTYGGTGLGLYVCKQIVELMGGNIKVESEVDKGTTFIFTVNLHAEADGEEENEVTLDDLRKLLIFDQDDQAKEPFDFFAQENINKINDFIEKTVLCVELENWGKAEGFAASLKRIAEGGPQELSKLAFRLVMNVRKEKQDECRKYLEEMKKTIDLIQEAGAYSG